MAKSKVRGVYDDRRKLKFLKSLATSSHVSASAKAAGVSVSTVYNWRERDPEFFREWMRALAAGYELLEMDLLDRARNGVEKPVSTAIASPGRALMPWSPVHPRWSFQENGDLEIGWTRRSRAGTIWPDHVEVPLAEEAERYRVELLSNDGSDVDILLEPLTSKVIVPAMQIESFSNSDINHLSVIIYQIGSHGLSEPLAFEIPF